VGPVARPLTDRRSSHEPPPSRAGWPPASGFDRAAWHGPRSPGARPILRRERSTRCGAGGRGQSRRRRPPARERPGSRHRRTGTAAGWRGGVGRRGRGTWAVKPRFVRVARIKLRCPKSTFGGLTTAEDRVAVAVSATLLLQIRGGQAKFAVYADRCGRT